MRPRIACLLAMMVAAGLTAQVVADDTASPPSRGIFPIFRQRSKPQTAAPAEQVTTQTVASTPVLAPPPANTPAAPAAPAAAPAPATTVIMAPPSTGTPCINVSDPDGGYPMTPSYQATMNERSRLGQREVDCLGCMSCQGYWRFFFGGCRSFWHEGRHEPDYNRGCNCGNR
jgi:hypothetical protein